MGGCVSFSAGVVVLMGRAFDFLVVFGGGVVVFIFFVCFFVCVLLDC